MIPIQRHAYKMTVCGALYFFIAATIGARSTEIDTGTYLSAFLEQDFILMAADSRRTVLRRGDGDRSVRDDTCKITILGPQAAFMIMGFNSARVGSTTVIDAGVLAKEAYKSANRDIQEAARLWAIRAKDIPKDLGGSDVGHISMGFFAGFGSDGRAYLRTDTIDENGRDVSDETYWSPGGKQLYFWEHHQLVRQIVSSPTAKAMAVDPSLAPISRFGRMLNYLMESVIDARHRDSDETVGGPVAIYALERGKPGHWLYRTQPCDESNR